MSTILTNKIETKSGGLTLDAGSGNSINIVGDISGYATTEYVDTATAGSGGSGLIASDRVNVNKQALKLEYLQGIFNGLNATDAQVGRLLDNAVDYDSSHVGIVSDIFDTSSNVLNATSVTVSSKSPLNGFGSVQLQQDVTSYGTNVSEKAVYNKDAVIPFWQASGNSRGYDDYDYSIFSYMYSPNGTKLWGFAKANNPNSYYVSVVVEFDLNTPFDVSAAFDLYGGLAVVEHEDLNDQNFGTSDAFGDEFNIYYDPELNVVRLVGRDNFPGYVFVEYQVTGESITGVNRIISQTDTLDNMTDFVVGNYRQGNGIFNGDGTKFLAVEFLLGDPYLLRASTFDVSIPFSTDRFDFANTGFKEFDLSGFAELANAGFIGQDNCPLIRMNQAGDSFSVYQVINTDQSRLYSFVISMNNFVIDSNSQITSQTSFSNYSTSNNILYNNSTLVHNGDLLVSNDRGRFVDLDQFSSWDYIELNAGGLGDIQTPGTFERSIDLTNDLDSPPTSVVLTQQDNSDDANVTISVDISDGTNTVTINALDTEVDCSALTSRTLTATWNLSVADIQGTNAKIENYALNFR